MANFWQILTTFGVGDTAQKAGKAAEEAEKLRELQIQQNRMVQEQNEHNQKMLELQKEQLRIASMTDKQKLEYQKQKAKKEQRAKLENEIYGDFRPDDPFVRKALEIAIQKGKFSTAMMQTYLGLNHSHIMALADWLENLGIISPAVDNKPRDIYIRSLDEFDEMIAEAVNEILGD